MTDIVNRLRERKDIGNELSLPPTDLEIEAADEIERLRAHREQPSSDEMAEIRKAIQEAHDVGAMGISGRSWVMLVMAAEGYVVLTSRNQEGGK